jgi:hypothetical protein
MNPNTPENTPEVQKEQVQAATPVVQEASPEIKSEENKANWKAFREQRESERKAKEAAERAAAEERARADALKAALEAVTNKPQQRNDNYSNNQDDIAETEEQRIDRRVDALLKQREAAYEQQRQERERQEAPTRIIQTYPDFNQVVTTENCDYLDYHYPELTAPFKYMPEGYEKWNAMYKAVKKFVPNTEHKKEAAKADKNLAKPGSVSTPGTTQGGNAMPGARLDESRKEANWARMQKLLKGLS